MCLVGRLKGIRTGSSKLDLRLVWVQPGCMGIFPSNVGRIDFSKSSGSLRPTSTDHASFCTGEVSGRGLQLLGGCGVALGAGGGAVAED